MFFIFLAQQAPWRLPRIRHACAHSPRRSIPIVSKLDFTHPANSSLSHHTCGVGEIAWNIVATSPFAREASVTSWEDLSALLDQLRGEPEEYINQLQVMPWSAAPFHLLREQLFLKYNTECLSKKEPHQR